MTQPSPPPLQVPWPQPPVSFSTALKVHPEDFVVDEIPAYEPGGEGDFLYLWVQKKDVSSEWLIKALSERLGVRRDEIGTAGRKDRRAVTRQWVSIPARDVDDTALSRIDGPVGKAGELRLLRTERHTNKLKTGHLRANRFEVTLRGDALADEANVSAIEAGLTRAAQRGTPNLYGGQRFLKGDTVEMGLEALGGRRMKNKRLLKLGVSAVQSAVFNHWLAARVAAGNLEVALEGDVLQKRGTGGTFHCEDPAVDGARVRSGELVVTGPMPGNKYRAGKAAAAVYEAEALAQMGLTPASFKPIGKLAMGTRRAAWIVPTDIGFRRGSADPGEAASHSVTLSFTLPKGAYATVLLGAIAGADSLPFPTPSKVRDERP